MLRRRERKEEGVLLTQKGGERGKALTSRTQRVMAGIAWPEFETKLWTYVRRRVDGGSADDVVGEILLRLIRTQDKMEGAKDPTAWMYRVAANVITDHYRKNASRRRLMDAVRYETTGADGPEAVLDQTGSLAHCLIPMIKCLPAPYDEALMLTEIEGTTQVAAAKQLGLSVSGMKSRVQRARRKLKTTLLRCCVVEVNRRGDVLVYEKREAESGCGGPGRC